MFLYLGWYLGPGLSALPAEQLLLSRSVGRANRGSLDSHSPRSDYSSRRDFISSLARSRLSLVSLSFSSLSLSLSLSLSIYSSISFSPSFHLVPSLSSSVVYFPSFSADREWPGLTWPSGLMRRRLAVLTVNWPPFSLSVRERLFLSLDMTLQAKRRPKHDESKGKLLALGNRLFSFHSVAFLGQAVFFVFSVVSFDARKRGQKRE